MSGLPLISVVVPAFNPQDYLLAAIGSVEWQTWTNWECVVVDDGSDKAESLAILDKVRTRSDDRIRVVRQENKGPAGARNAGFRAARGKYVVTLDADDILEPQLMEVCRREVEADPHASFAYFDYHVFGGSTRLQRCGEYNLYRLLDENFISGCSFFSRAVWEETGGYDEWHRWGYEDWSFNLNLGKHGYYGHYVAQPLFRYRSHGHGMHQLSLSHHEANMARMREVHHEILSPAGRLRVKRGWAPSICVVVAKGPAPDLANQTLQDFQLIRASEEAEALELSSAGRFLWLEGGRPLHPQALEECVWGLDAAQWVAWKDTGDAPPPSLTRFAGPLGLAREVLEWPEPKRSGVVRRLPGHCFTSRRIGEAGGAPPVTEPLPRPASTAPKREVSEWAERLWQHLENAELLSAESWKRHPWRSAARLVPLRWKERINALAGKPVFDLSFYLKFQPRSALAASGALLERLDYIVREPGPRRRIALVTPHLGVGGAESVLLEAARQIDRERFEVTLVAVQSRDSRLRRAWEQTVDWVFDLEKLVPAESAQRFLYSLALNWRFDAVLIQNALAAYSVLPPLREKLSGLRAADLLHAVDEDWDFFSATLDVSALLDCRVVISEAGRRRLEEMAVPAERIRVVPNGVDLARFDPGQTLRGPLRRALRIPQNAAVVAFVGRLDPVKRPRLLPYTAQELQRLIPDREVFFLVAGGGPEEDRLRSKLDSAGLGEMFRLLGYRDDIEAILGESDVLLMTSAGEGVPLAMLEALAMKVPVVASRAGALEEALPKECGILVEPGPGEERRLAEALAGLLADEAKRQSMGEAARRYAAARHDIAASRAAYRELFEELLAGAIQPNLKAPSR